MHKYFKHIVDSNYILEWRSKGISDKNITPPSASYNFLTPSLNYLGTKRKVRFIGSCLKQEKIRYSQGKTVNIYIVYEINRNENTTSSDPTLENCVFGTFSLNKNADIDQNKYSGYGTGFDRKGTFSVGNGVDKNIIIFGVDMRLSIKIDYRKKDILILGKGTT